MRPFEYARAQSVEGAVGQPGKFLAGGTTLIDLMKLDVERPSHLTDITPLRENGELSQIVEDGEGVRIGALASMSQTAEHALIAERYPALREALLAGASQQIRNMASMGGNIMQRTRCPYFRDLAFKECNKRDPGSGCGAREGHHRKMAILGGSDQCIATHASDASVALVAYGASVVLRGPDGERTVRMEDFNLLPGETPHIEHDLRDGELIVALILPAPIARNAVYLKVRDRESYEFALSSCAAVLDVQDGKVNAARVALGGVGTKPWRSPEAEAALVDQPATRETFEAAARAALQHAHPLAQNAFKVPLTARVIVRALMQAAGLVDEAGNSIEGAGA
ncbi:FAD binding domain-containing protein [Deinococcus marmoris]|uniref:Periplasmic aromatic aldehyde oxidoreductase, FAD binding subunit YagS n=1 Tax=Deinococcus marmoris TaxID=249408 RepID=A0A1U7NVR5_9DEIO|nr:xanthine dehydrogenase family protein subunit M [Deinococcus marmoris]OLV17004.1 Periplasmic aromatic aldehyde oxidoreductase, FAD binding subunit YagS [Deinococcus marmoris]